MSKKLSPDPRPPGRITASRRSRVLRLRVRDRELVDWKARAQRADVTLSEWIRARVEAGNRQEDALKANVS